MFRAFLIVNGTPDETRLEQLENAGRLIHYVLKQCGTTPHLSSLHHVWVAVQKNFTMFELELFPGEVLQTPQHIQLPSTAKPLHAVTETNWIIHCVHIAPGYQGLMALLSPL